MKSSTTIPQPTSPISDASKSQNPVCSRLRSEHRPSRVTGDVVLGQFPVSDVYEGLRPYDVYCVVVTHYIAPPSSNQKLFRICAYRSIGLMLILLAFSRSNWLDDRLSHAIGWGAVSLLIVVMVGVYVSIFRDSVDKA